MYQLVGHLWFNSLSSARDEMSIDSESFRGNRLKTSQGEKSEKLKQVTGFNNNYIVTKKLRTKSFSSLFRKGESDLITDASKTINEKTKLVSLHELPVTAVDRGW